MHGLVVTSEGTRKAPIPIPQYHVPCPPTLFCLFFFCNILNIFVELFNPKKNIQLSKEIYKHKHSMIKSSLNYRI